MHNEPSVDPSIMRIHLRTNHQFYIVFVGFGLRIPYGLLRSARQWAINLSRGGFAQETSFFFPFLFFAAGYDDQNGDYTIVMHDHIAYRYEVLSLLGKGSFGQVWFLRVLTFSAFSALLTSVRWRVPTSVTVSILFSRFCLPRSVFLLFLCCTVLLCFHCLTTYLACTHRPKWVLVNNSSNTLAINLWSMKSQISFSFFE